MGNGPTTLAHTTGLHHYQEQLGGHGAVSTENFIEAIKHLNWHAVEENLRGGIKVNAPLDPQGHTVLDLFAKVHESKVHDMRSAKNQGEPVHMTKLYIEEQEAAFQTMRILREHGAIFASRTAITQKGF